MGLGRGQDAARLDAARRPRAGRRAAPPPPPSARGERRRAASPSELVVTDGEIVRPVVVDARRAGRDARRRATPRRAAARTRRPRARRRRRPRRDRRPPPPPPASPTWRTRAPARTGCDVRPALGLRHERGNGGAGQLRQVVAAVQHRDDAGGRPRGRGVDRADARVGVRAAHEGQVEQVRPAAGRRGSGRRRRRGGRLPSASARRRPAPGPGPDASRGFPPRAGARRAGTGDRRRCRS